MDSSSRQPATPACFEHKATGQAVVKLGGRFVYLGAFGSEQAQQRYLRVVAEWKAKGSRALAREAMVDDPVAGYWCHAEVHYRKNGKPTSEQSVLRLALRPARTLRRRAGRPVRAAGAEGLPRGDGDCC